MCYATERETDLQRRRGGRTEDEGWDGGEIGEELSL